MGLRDILVVLDGSSRSSVQLGLAVELARAHDAHLGGVCPLDLLLPPGGPGALEAAFREQLRVNGVRGAWAASRGPAHEVIATALRSADLAVMGQADGAAERSAVMRDLLADVLMRAGRPVLAVPYAGTFSAAFRTVLVAWNGSREAARALNDALPLLEQAESVTVLSVQGRRALEREDVPGADAAEHLARHGIAAVAVRVSHDGGASEADAILNYAADLGAELLVAGCYGHSRARERVLGGVSRGLLEAMTLPVLLSH